MVDWNRMAVVMGDSGYLHIARGFLDPRNYIHIQDGIKCRGDDSYFSLSEDPQAQIP